MQVQNYIKQISMVTFHFSGLMKIKKTHFSSLLTHNTHNLYEINKTFICVICNCWRSTCDMNTQAVVSSTNEGLVPQFELVILFAGSLGKPAVDWTVFHWG